MSHVVAAAGELVSVFVAGDHRRDLIDAGRASAVLSVGGTALRQLHDRDPRKLDPAAEVGGVACNNVLIVEILAE